MSLYISIVEVTVSRSAIWFHKKTNHKAQSTRAWNFCTERVAEIDFAAAHRQSRSSIAGNFYPSCLLTKCQDLNRDYYLFHIKAIGLKTIFIGCSCEFTAPARSRRLGNWTSVESKAAQLPPSAVSDMFQAQARQLCF